ncbi:MAG: hypothetical protein AABX86_02055, partial [Nanoarchaeota archaeon]
FEKLRMLSKRYGFDLLVEGGYYNSLVIDGPIFTKQIKIVESEKVMETANSGYLKVLKTIVMPKMESIYNQGLQTS